MVSVSARGDSAGEAYPSVVVEGTDGIVECLNGGASPDKPDLLKVSSASEQAKMKQKQKSLNMRVSKNSTVSFKMSISSYAYNYDSDSTDTTLPRTSINDTGSVGKPDVNEESAKRFLRMRQDSVLIRVKPGQSFSEHADLLVDLPSRCDPRLGTLGELRHLLRTGTKNQVKKFLRTNNWPAGHRIRAELWKELCHDINMDAQRLLHKETIQLLSLDQESSLRPSVLSAPSVVLSHHQLKESSKKNLLRLLTVIEHVRTDITYIPILHALCALLMHFMAEDEAFACVMRLLAHSQKFLHQTDIAASASKRTLMMLTRKHMHKIQALLKHLVAAESTARGNKEKEEWNVLPVYDEWKHWIFRDLPFCHLVRVVDCYLFEGQKVLFRVALAILYLWYKHNHKSLHNKRGIGVLAVQQDIASFCCHLPIEPGKLLRLAFGIRNLKTSTIIKLQQAHEIKLRRSNSQLTSSASSQQLQQLTASHHFVGLDLHSEILSNQQAQILVSWVPPRYQLYQIRRLFSLDHDGNSFNTFWNKIETVAPTLLIVKTIQGHIFGAYCSSEWSSRKHGKDHRVGYFGTGETFLFRFCGQFGAAGEKFTWVGAGGETVAHSDELFLTAGNTMFCIGGGGGEGLVFRDTLEEGSTDSCTTFANPPLVPEKQFLVQNLEIIGFLPDED